jgi:hypothetical protein
MFKSYCDICLEKDFCFIKGACGLEKWHEEDQSGWADDIEDDDLVDNDEFGITEEEDYQINPDESTVDTD